MPDDAVQPVRITAFQFDDAADTALSDLYSVTLTLVNMPASTYEKTTRPFKITTFQTIYNPIALLPASTVFTYVVGYSATRRCSQVNTHWIEQQPNGDYAYYWTTGDRLEFTNVYPNRPLYYLLVLVGAITIGVIVYYVSKYKAKHHQPATKDKIPVTL